MQENFNSCITAYRSKSRQYLETLEYWLKRLIDQQLSESYGEDYLFIEENGENLIKNDVKNKLISRKKFNPKRFSKPIDAATLDEIIYIICKDCFFKKYFQPFLKDVFFLGSKEAREILNRIKDIRNRLSHSNPISWRDYKRVQFYSEEIIESMKNHYRILNKEKDYNVPQIQTYRDSLGNHFERDSNSNENSINDDWIIPLLEIKESHLFPGDKIHMEVVVDPTFPTDYYDVKWDIPNADLYDSIRGYYIDFEVKEFHVSTAFYIKVYVITKNNWHKHSSYDDKLMIIFKVLPPQKDYPNSS